MVVDTRVSQVHDSLCYVRKWCKVISVVLWIVVLAMSAICALTMVAMLGVVVNGNPDVVGPLAYASLRDITVITSLIMVASMFADASANATPFGEKQTKRLRIIGALLLLLVAIELLFDASYSGTLSFFGAQLAVSAEATRSLDMPALILAALAFCMSVIFQYGALLQEGHDETV